MVVSAYDGGIIYTGEKFKYATHMIALVKSVYEENDETKAHYDVLTSVPAFINKSYFSQYCWKGYGQEHPRKHNCKSQNCPACLRRRMKGESGCGDFTGWAKPDVYCAECNFWFYGDQLTKKERQSLKEALCKHIPLKTVMASETRRKCKICQVTYNVNLRKPHKCLHMECRNCLEYVNIHEHQCYITSEAERARKYETRGNKCLEMCRREMEKRLLEMMKQ